MRSLRSLGVLAALLASGTAVEPLWSRLPREIVGRWEAPPANVPTSSAQPVADGPFSGNGDAGLVVGAPSGELRFYYDLTQLHVPAGDAGMTVCGYDEGKAGHVGVGWLAVAILANRTGRFGASQLIRTAEVRTETLLSNGGALRSRSTVLATQNLIVHELSLEGGQPVRLNVSSNMHNTGSTMACRLNRAGLRPGWLYAESRLGRGYHDKRGLGRLDRHPLIQRVEQVAVGTRFDGLFRHVANGTDDDGRRGTAAWRVVELDPGGRLVLSSQLWTARDFNYSRSPLEAVAQSMQAVRDGSAHMAQLREQHANWWDGFWSKSALSIPSSPKVAEFYYGARYLWGCTERSNYSAHLPPAGLWKNHYTSNDYPWPAFTTDINTQAPYFGAFSSNHLAVPEAMYQLNLDFIPAGRSIAQMAFGCPGVLQPVEIGARGAILIMSDQGIRSNALLAAVNFIFSFRHTRDVAWLKTVGYPFLKEVAEFWTCYLTKDPQSGVYNDLNDCCYEICGANDYPQTEGQAPDNNFERQDNPANSLGMLRQHFEFMLVASELLGVDQALRPTWADILHHLAPLPTAVWPKPGVGNVTVLADFENAGLPPLRDRQMLSALQPIYPGSLFSQSMPNRTEFGMARNLVDYLNWTGAGWPNGADTSCIMFTIYGRLGYNGSEVYEMFTRDNPGYVPLQPNLMTNAQIGPAMVQYVNELFVQSHERFIRLFNGYHTSASPDAPVPPKPAPASCSFTGQWDMPIGQGELVQSANGSVRGWCCSSSPSQRIFDMAGNLTGKSEVTMVWHTADGKAVGPEIGSLSADCSSIAWRGSDQGYTRVGSNKSDYYSQYMSIRPWLGSQFVNLRAEGAFLISGEMSAAGRIGNITVVSEKGQDFVWLELRPGRPIVIESASATAVPVSEAVRVEAAVHIDRGKLWQFSTKPDASYVLVA